MKAIMVREFGDPGVLRLEDVPDPVPGPGEVLVRVRAAGVNPVETYRRSGRYAALPALPYVPGSDAAGEIVAVGTEVRRWAEGDRVYTDHRARGAYAELLRCREEAIHRLPPGVGYADGASLGVPCATAYRALFHRGNARPGERVLVHGATGGVGLAAVQLARAAGLEVTATGGSEEGRREVLRQGAHFVLDHTADDHEERLALAAGSNGFDIVLEMLANVNLSMDLQALGRRGRVVVIGSRGTIEVDPRATMARDADIRGLTLFNTSPQDLTEIHAALYAALENGSLRPVIGAELPLAEAARAHREVIGSRRVGKIVLIP